MLWLVSVLLILQGTLVAAQIGTEEGTAYLVLNIVLALLATFACIFISSLLFLHVYLILNNQTTNEYFK